MGQSTCIARLASTAAGITTLAILATLFAAPAFATDDHLLLCEAVVTPTESEFIELANPTAAAVSLDQYYLSDDEDYALLPGAFGAGPAPSIGSSDFIAQFPAGATIPAGGVVVVAFDGAGFLAAFGFAADFEIAGTDAGTPDMIATDVGASAGLTNSGENAVLFFWDGASDLVSDVDMLNIGTPSSTNDIADKTGISVDGPDADTTASAYATDAFTIPQQAGDPGFGFSTKRILFEVGSEATGGGNGLTGDDETTELITTTWDAPPFTAPDPGVCTVGSPPSPVLVINEIDYDQPSTDTAEFLEIKNDGIIPVDLDPYAVELVNGTGGGASVYQTIDLPAVSLAPGDYYVVCADATATLNCDLEIISSIQNGAPDAVALTLAGAIVDTVSYEGDAGAPYTEGSGAGLQDPGTSGNDNIGISRFPDGADTDVNNVDLSTRCITPGAANTADNTNCGTPAPPVLVINEIDYDQPSSDTAEFLEIKNNGTSPIDLDPYTVELINGTGGGAALYQSVDLPAVSLGPGGYYVLCADALTVSNCDLEVLNSIQNGAPDAVALTLAGAIVDTVSYEGDTGAPYTEGSGLGLEDPGTSGNDNLGISRFPDGGDTDINNIDLSTRCITPGAPNTADSTNCPAAGPAALVINEIDYDQPSSDTAEFLEIKNIGSGVAQLDQFELQLVNGATGTAYQTIALPTFSLAPDDYFVVCADATTVANCDLATINSIQNGAPDAVALVSAGVIVDTVSYEGDTAAPYTEGSGVGLQDPGTTGNDFIGISRSPDGADTDVNNVDFVTSCITPGLANTNATTNCSPFGPAFEIFEIQGAGLTSPFEGQTVTTVDNVVTAVAPNGFFIQTPVARTDGDPETSDGILVFTTTPPTVAEGDLVTVTGQVVEFFNLTELGTPTVTVTSTGNPLPPAVVLDATTPSPNQPQPANEMERFEGMVVIFDGIASGPTDRFGDTPVTAQASRAFREPGIVFPGLVGLPVWDGNPELFEVNADGLGGADTPIFAGQAVAAEGPLSFSFGDYQVLPKSLAIGPAPTLPRPVRARNADEMTIASQNMLRLFDDVDNGIGEPVLTTMEFDELLDKFSLHIRTVLGAPDILAVQEVENINVLSSLAARIQADDPALVYSAHLIEGNDVGGIDVGYLTRDDTIQVISVTQFGATQTLTFDGSLLHDRPPLVLEADYIGGGSPFPLTVIGVHNRSLSGIEGSSATRVKTKRLEQAQAIAQLVQDLQTVDPNINLVVTGDFNGFQFTDGYVDVLGQITGNLDPLGGEFPATDIVNPDLTNQIVSLPAGEQYSFVFGGSAQSLDHVLTSVALNPAVTDVAYARGNADVPASFGDDPTTPLRVSDHDGLVLYINTFQDEDGDGVEDGEDLCPGTMIPESVPTVRLGLFRYALTDGDNVFDTRVPPWFPHTPPSFTTTDTGGCSCEQIIDNLGFDHSQSRFGCKLFVMKIWVYKVNQ